MEYRLFEQGTLPHVSTAAFHADRDRAPHLEQPVHRDRLLTARDLVLRAYAESGVTDVVDLGCGDGGMLQLLGEANFNAWGYDFQPSNAAGWKERGVRAEALNFALYPHQARWAPIVVMTEVLEHMANPHGYLKRYVRRNARFLVCSSPRTETDESHDACHAWAWDEAGYRALVENAGFEVMEQHGVGMFQIVLAKRR